ncbi:hypothetical protein HLI_20260 [Halobacillus litoralis]|uniref:Uncharacterized protein n=2 Tax=Halobacillus litoralis TaxID=45668 RepID=A0A410MI24_9BACI|nr:hypothetical protein HLI_20260 [Halobacillus litoralis]
MMMNRKGKPLYMKILIAALIIALFFSVKTWNDNRERSLGELVNYDEEKFAGLGFTQNRNQIPEGQGFQWWTSNEEAAKELDEFFSQYNVKKISEEHYNKRLNKEPTFQYEIQLRDSNPILVHGMATRIHILVGHYYEVTNGPIDREWLVQFSKKYGESS